MEGGSQASVINARSPLVVRHRNGSAVRVEGTNVTPGPRSPQLRRPERLHRRVAPMQPVLTFIAAAALVEAEARIDLSDVARGVAYIASLSLEANVQFMTVMATKIPYIGRG